MSVFRMTEVGRNEDYRILSEMGVKVLSKEKWCAGWEIHRKSNNEIQ